MNSDSISSEDIYVHNVGVFQIIHNDGKGDCLFRSISQALHDNSQKFHSSIRKLVVQHATTHRMWNVLGEPINRYWGLEHILKKEFALAHRNWRRCFQMKRNRLREKRRENKWKYRQLMSQGAFPGTSYELRAAADLFGFHVDFLVDLNVNTAKDSSMHIENCIRLYQFFSCRNNRCQVQIGEQYPRLYFIHRKNLQTAEGGHWELIIPRALLLDTMPLHRKIYAISSIDCRQLEVETDVHDQRDILILRRMNEIGRQIDILVSRNVLIPYEDPDWPPEDRDNYLGCTQHNHCNMYRS